MLEGSEAVRSKDPLIYGGWEPYLSSQNDSGSWCKRVKGVPRDADAPTCFALYAIILESNVQLLQPNTQHPTPNIHPFPLQPFNLHPLTPSKSYLQVTGLGYGVCLLYAVCDVRGVWVLFVLTLNWTCLCGHAAVFAFVKTEEAKHNWQQYTREQVTFAHGWLGRWLRNPYSTLRSEQTLICLFVT
ncbi:hypothetical protein VNO78_23481 [Psophocarpus tetragonolobus]|uniref:Uncharacterized protein n=1 Tax=Psophocarpus tetragonolobus TaxID=3891 RepID=A0AAN9S6Q5_PSOTE